MKTAAILVLLSVLRAFGQEQGAAMPADTALMRFLPGDTTLRLPHPVLIRGRMQVFVDSTRLPERAYSVDWGAGRIGIIDSSLIPVDSLHPRVLRVIYVYVPIQLQERYAHRQLVINDDTAGPQRFTVRSKSAPLTVDNMFGPGFQKSGTLIRGVSAGNRQDVLLNSGFQLQFSGRVAGDVEVIGSLTDNNTPIQPEGNTQTLQELDKVFLTVRAPSVSGTLGDFVTTVTGTDLAGVTRKVQGGEVTAHSDLGEARAIAATTRGKYRTMQFQGLDGVQGPYRLTGENGENGIIVIAGTEHVFIDGVVQSRGENLDYVIDYSTAEVTFSTRRMITSASRISIEYQYSDRKYARSLLGGQASVHSADTSVRFTATWLREADNQDAPLDISLSDADRALLAAAGGDRAKASRTGISDAGLDSVTNRGRGFYARRDTVINGLPDSVFVYAPGDSLARYALSFTFVGVGNGTYVRVAGQEYRFAGARAGDYVPVVYLAMPQRTQMLDGRLSAAIATGVSAVAEFALSDVSLNRFSTAPDAQLSGTGGTFSLLIAPQKLAGAGTLEGSFRMRALSPMFRSIDRIDEIEFARRWNLSTSTQQQKQNLSEGRVTCAPLDKTTIGAEVGEIRVGDSFSTLRQQYSVMSSSLKELAAAYRVEILHSTGAAGLASSQWTRHMGDLRYALGMFTPGMHVEAESRTDMAHGADSLPATTDTLTPQSYRFVQWGPRLQVAPTTGLGLFGEYAVRAEDSVLTGSLQRQSNTTIYRAGFDMVSLGGVTGSGEFSVRNKSIEQAFSSGEQNAQSVLLRLQGSARPMNGAIAADLFYSSATQRASKLERRFVLVPYGTGQYVYLGDLNHNGVQDENEFSLTNAADGTYTLIYRPADQLYPIIDLKSSARVRLKPALALGTKPQGVAAVIALFSGETYLRIDERSTTQALSDVYLLHLGTFLDERFTLAGAQQIQQDLFFMENDPEFNLRGRYSERRSLTELAATGERAYQREQSLRVRWHLIAELTSELTGALLRDELAATGPTVNTPRALGTTQFTSDLSYRPLPEWEIGWKADLRTTTDAIIAPAVVADKNFQTVRAAYSFAGFGRIQGEVERDRITLNALPTGYTGSFQLTDGFSAGDTYIARAIFEYRVTANVQATANYTGRMRESAVPMHTFQAEVRAMF